MLINSMSSLKSYCFYLSLRQRQEKTLNVAQVIETFKVALRRSFTSSQIRVHWYTQSLTQWENISALKMKGFGVMNERIGNNELSKNAYILLTKITSAPNLHLWNTLDRLMRENNAILSNSFPQRLSVWPEYCCVALTCESAHFQNEWLP